MWWHGYALCTSRLPPSSHGTSACAGVRRRTPQRISIGDLGAYLIPSLLHARTVWQYLSGPDTRSGQQTAQERLQPDMQARDRQILACPPGYLCSPSNSVVSRENAKSLRHTMKATLLYFAPNTEWCTLDPVSVAGWKRSLSKVQALSQMYTQVTPTAFVLVLASKSLCVTE